MVAGFSSGIEARRLADDRPGRGIGLFGAIAFRQLFTLFHALFFEGDSWLFLYSDTLIRQFPMQFWQDAFLWAGVIAIGGALWLALGLKDKKSQGKTD